MVLLVDGAADAMPGEFPQDREAAPFHLTFDRLTNGMDGLPGFRGRHSGKEGGLGALDQVQHHRRRWRDGHGDSGVGNTPVHEGRDVAPHHVPGRRTSCAGLTGHCTA